jgi:hypothetical protein
MPATSTKQELAVPASASFAPPADLSRRAHIPSFEAYLKLHDGKSGGSRRLLAAARP